MARITRRGSGLGFGLYDTLGPEDLAKFTQTADKWANDACKSKAAAKAALIEVGLLTPAGRPSPRYYPKGSEGHKAKWNV